MNVVGFIGSPRRKGNTATLVGEVLRGAQEAGAQVAVYDLNALDIRGCQGCRACKKPGAACVQQDDMQALYGAIAGADAVVIGTPVYMAQVTGQTKVFLDRLYAFLNDDFTHRLGAGKKTILVYTQGQPNPGAFQASFDLNALVLALLGLKVCRTLVATGTRRPDDILKNREILEEAYRAGAALTARAEGVKGD
jgi:multimeric flavodoxin WrbA